MKRRILKLIIRLRNMLAYKCQSCGGMLIFSHYYGEGLSIEDNMRVYKCRKCKQEWIAL